MIKVPEYLCYWSRDSEIIIFLFWKFHWVWRAVGGTSRIIKKMTDYWGIILDSSQSWNCVEEVSWVSLLLPTWLRNYNLSYSGSFSEFDVMSEERPKLSRKWRISGKLFWTLDNAKKCVDRSSWVSLVMVTWLRNYRLSYFGNFTQLVVILEKRPELSTKWWIFGDLFFRQ